MKFKFLLCALLFFVTISSANAVLIVMSGSGSGSSYLPRCSDLLVSVRNNTQAPLWVTYIGVKGTTKYKKGILIPKNTSMPLLEDNGNATSNNYSSDNVWSGLKIFNIIDNTKVFSGVIIKNKPAAAESLALIQTEPFLQDPILGDGYTSSAEDVFKGNCSNHMSMPGLYTLVISK